MLDAATRQEQDSLGSVTIPQDAYYAAQTERARQNFDVSGQFLGDFPRYVTAIVEVKKAAALANADIGVLRQPVADAICQAADEIIAGTFDRTQFPVDILSAGGGVSPNMNVNEVLANRANEILSGSKGYDLVHPNNHVNTGQSTSDVLATAMNIALHRDILGLLDSMRLLEEVIGEKIEQYSDTVKLSRTCLQDASRSRSRRSSAPIWRSRGAASNASASWPTPAWTCRWAAPSSAPASGSARAT
jgi:aspartate ammonia-lyase